MLMCNLEILPHYFTMYTVKRIKIVSPFCFHCYNALVQNTVIIVECILCLVLLLHEITENGRRWKRRSWWQNATWSTAIQPEAILNTQQTVDTNLVHCMSRKHRIITSSFLTLHDTDTIILPLSIRMVQEASILLSGCDVIILWRIILYSHNR
jgi:hypothetical protein